MVTRDKYDLAVSLTHFNSDSFENAQFCKVTAEEGPVTESAFTRINSAFFRMNTDVASGDTSS